MKDNNIAVDLGTANIRIFTRRQGLIVDEPFIAAVDTITGNVLAYGEAAYSMMGRTCAHVVISRPVDRGAVSDLSLASNICRHFFKPVIKSKLLALKTCAVIPGELTEIEKRAVAEALKSCGVKRVSFIEETIATALGANADISTPLGNMVVNIGAGTTQIATLSLNDIGCEYSLKVAGDDFDDNIIRYVRKEHNLIIGRATAQRAKESIGSVYPMKSIMYHVVKGRNALNGLPEAVRISSNELTDCLTETSVKILKAIQNILEASTPETVSDISYEGIILAGGGAKLKGIATLISRKTGIRVRVANEPSLCAVLGANKYISK